MQQSLLHTMNPNKNYQKIYLLLEWNYVFIPVWNRYTFHFLESLFFTIKYWNVPIWSIILYCSWYELNKWTEKRGAFSKYPRHSLYIYKIYFKKSKNTKIQMCLSEEYMWYENIFFVIFYQPKTFRIRLGFCTHSYLSLILIRVALKK